MGSSAERTWLAAGLAALAFAHGRADGRAAGAGRGGARCAAGAVPSSDAAAVTAAAAAAVARRRRRSATARGTSRPSRRRIHVTVVTKQLERPWGLAFLPNGDMLVTERPGRLRIVRGGVLDPAPIAGMPTIRAVVIGGLADVVLHPDFARNRLVYFSYSKPDAQDETLSTLAVARARFDGGAALTNVEDIFVAKDWYSSAMAGQNGRCCGQGPADASFGARMAFGRDGMLYVASGDRNWGEKAQEPSSHLGKIIRIRDDGKVPRDNPFVGQEGYLPRSTRSAIAIRRGSR